MNKALVLLLAILVAQSSFLPNTTSQNKVQQFLQGFTSGYTNTNFTMPSDCFSDEINDEMYAYIIKITQSVVLMDVGAIQSSIFNFMLYMSDFADKCGISGIVNSVFSDFQEETSAYIIARIMEYAFDIQTDIYQGVFDIEMERYEAAGTQFGKALADIAPNKQFQAKQDIDFYNFTQFYKGLVQGLNLNLPKNSCQLKLEEAFYYFPYVIYNIEARDYYSLQNNFQHLLMNLKTAVNGCNLVELQNKYSEITQEELKENFYKNWKQISISALVFLNADTSCFYKGASAGQVISYLLEWKAEPKVKGYQSLQSAQITPEDASQFYDGFIQGVSPNSTLNACGNQMIQLDENITNFVTEIQQFLQFDFSEAENFVEGLYNFYSNVIAVSSECDFGTLITQVEGLSQAVIMQRYAENFFTINWNLYVFHDSSKSFYERGEAAGIIFRLEVNWQLQDN